MADSARAPDRVPDPLQAIRDDMQFRQVEAANLTDLRARRLQLDGRMADRFGQLISFVGGLLAPEVNPREAMQAKQDQLKDSDMNNRLFNKIYKAANIGKVTINEAIAPLSSGSSKSMKL